MSRRLLPIAWGVTIAAIVALVVWAAFVPDGAEPERIALRLVLPDRPAAEPAETPTAKVEAEAQEAPAAERASLPAALPEPSPATAPVAAPTRESLARPPAEVDAAPRIAIIIAQLGLSRTATQAAIDRLPAEVTLAFASYAADLGEWIEKARAHGHEVLLGLPMEPESFPADDPGPRALLTSLGTEANLDRLEWALGRAAGYVGVLSHMGAGFTASREHLQPVLDRLARQHLLFVDSRAAARSVVGAVAAEVGLTVAINDRLIDVEPTPAGIRSRLGELEEIARKRGRAVGVGLPYPVTVETVAGWAKDLTARGLALAPVSAVATAERRR